MREDLIQLVAEVVNNLCILKISGQSLDISEFLNIGEKIEISKLAGVSEQTKLCLISEMQKQNVLVAGLPQALNDVGLYVGSWSF